MMKTSHAGEVIISKKDIQTGVKLVAEQLNSLYQEAAIITVVPGGILYTADLVRELNFDVHMDYISCPHTPGQRENKSDIIFHNNVNINGMDVILIDDAIESGGTMKRLVEHLTQHYSIKSLAIATLFVKPGRIDIPVPQFYAWEMTNDDLLIGYGMPWQNKFRNLPEVCKLIK
ncbi:phosphoribosyltransferase [Klebsiella sp. BIGb0407]|uniref:phosphoribosyltransferase n=1 Tax=Klebsiella sp. BIGb0407 TaxID=2940603 RepID=UPI00216A512C|nr:phosphoribosyltransferase family protein [Klebsiella sp. BIGb0407]MCS3431281.1 hypoxanthine phosphoribosyltransferase [Klebsiella sp. BIGb0407]